MSLPKSAHTSQQWRIDEIVTDFELEDVWALPTPGGPDDFPLLVAGATSLDPSESPSGVVRMLFALRWKIGELFGWDDRDAGPDPAVPSLRERLPVDLLEAPGPDFDATPFTSLYLLRDEFAAEIVNRTVHGVLHLGWVRDGSGGYRGQMAVFVKRNGLLGTAYMTAIKPFRHLLVYPPLLQGIERQWQERVTDPRRNLPASR